MPKEIIYLQSSYYLRKHAQHMLQLHTIPFSIRHETWQFSNCFYYIQIIPKIIGMVIDILCRCYPQNNMKHIVYKSEMVYYGIYLFEGDQWRHMLLTTRPNGCYFSAVLHVAVFICLSSIVYYTAIYATKNA